MSKLFLLFSEHYNYYISNAPYVIVHIIIVNFSRLAIAHFNNTVDFEISH